MELYKLTATELSAKLVAGECTSVDILNSLFERIDAVEKNVGAFITITKEEAYLKAAEIDKKRATGEKLHPLAGIPFGVKDNICTENVLTTCASKILDNFIPPYNATVIEMLSECGAILIGKTNLDEFAMGSSTERSALKITRNPHGLDYVPGGSSGGSAAAVAAGECPISLGSDTGGSVRQPASYCGVVGIKPTYGAVSRYGLVAFASSLDQIGTFGRSVADAAMMLQAISGRDSKDATSSKREIVDYTKSLDGDVEGMVFGIPDEYFGEGVEPEVKNAVMSAISAMEAKGASVKRISLPSTEYALSAYYILASAEASSNLARFDGVKYGYRAKDYVDLNDMYERTRSEGFGDEVKRRIMLGTFVLSSGYYDAYYKRAKLLQKRISEEFANGFSQCDVMITPTAPATAFKLGENTSDPIKMYAADVCTLNVNIAGLPAISIPCGTGANGMPIGMQIIGPKFSEDKLFQVSACHEKICGGFNNVAAVREV